MNKGQNFTIAFSDSLLAEVGKVQQTALHFDLKAICRAYESIKPLAKRLGIEPPVPRLGGFGYTHLAGLGVKIDFGDSREPKPVSLIHSPEDIDKLTEPEDYLSAPLIQERLNICYELKKLYPKSPNFIGHLLEGPVTTAVLLMGSDFLTLPYDDPKRAHRLLEFCVQSALKYIQAIKKEFGESMQTGVSGFPDDFAGMFSPNIFEEFVVPYWEKTYQGLKSTERSLHSELLREGHMPFLSQLNIKYYDPGADKYLTPELLCKHCPCKFRHLITDWCIHDSSAEQLEALYREIAEFKPYTIAFCMSRLEDEPKIKHLLKTAREIKGE